MSTGLWILLLVVFVLICCSAFFSGSETALTAASRARLLSYEKNGDSRATVVQALIEKKDRLIGALLIGNNLVNILASSLATTAFLGLFGEAGVVYATRSCRNRRRSPRRTALLSGCRVRFRSSSPCSGR